MEPKLLGGGAFGKVFRGHFLKNKDYKVAIKVMDKAKLGKRLMYIKDEVQILQKLDHPNIIKVGYISNI